MDMMIENRLLRHALVLNRHGNFARAAAELKIAQPSLSRSIAALERALGVTLFDRSQKGVRPTVFGRILLERGETVLLREADLRREIQLLAGLEQGSLAISAGPYLDTSIARAIAHVAQAHPRLKIRCTTADPAEVVRELLAERIDVGVAAIGGLDREDRLVVEPLPVQRIYFACRPGHPLTMERSPSVARVLEFPLVTTLLRGPHAQLASSRGLKRSGGRTGDDFVPQIYVNSVALGRTIARESDAVFPGTAANLADDLAAGLLIRLDCDAPALRTNPGVMYLRNRSLAPAALAFIARLRAVEQEYQQADAGARAGTGVTRSRAPRRAPRSKPRP